MLPMCGLRFCEIKFCSVLVAMTVMCEVTFRVTIFPKTFSWAVVEVSLQFLYLDTRFLTKSTISTLVEFVKVPIKSENCLIV